jgi:hypothetical protein
MDIARAQEPLSIHHLGYFASLLLLEIDDRTKIWPKDQMTPIINLKKQQAGKITKVMNG